MKTNLNGIQKGMITMIDIKGLSKAQVLHALWHASKAQGLLFLGLLGGSFTIEDAQKEIDKQPCLYFDYVAGHVIKCDLSKDEFDERLFDRDNGDGTAAKAIENLRKGLISDDANDDLLESLRCIASMEKEGDE
jgi:hypothetical protein